MRETLRFVEKLEAAHINFANAAIFNVLFPGCVRRDMLHMCRRYSVLSQKPQKSIVHRMGPNKGKETIQCASRAEAGIYEVVTNFDVNSGIKPHKNDLKGRLTWYDTGSEKTKAIQGHS